MIPVAQLSMIRVILPLLELTVVMLPPAAVVAVVSSLSAPTGYGFLLARTSPECECEWNV